MQLPDRITEFVADMLIVAYNDKDSMGYVRDRFHDMFRDEIVKRGSGWVKTEERLPEQSDSSSSRLLVNWLVPIVGKLSKIETERWDSPRHRKTASHWSSIPKLPE